MTSWEPYMDRTLPLAASLSRRRPSSAAPFSEAPPLPSVTRRDSGYSTYSESFPPPLPPQNPARARSKHSSITPGSEYPIALRDARGASRASSRSSSSSSGLASSSQPPSSTAATAAYTRAAHLSESPEEDYQAEVHATSDDRALLSPRMWHSQSCSRRGSAKSEESHSTERRKSGRGWHGLLGKLKRSAGSN
ncbi:hypothetical protein CYLTODRAFT_447419 [Cylindrobasidium torrendii FP15055 ss-10]|uniref:Uncharacterized protein n=1 Tax=Cylindrobasidium torrendii FP15055 ss-10 TaxID=1314674 RepID=A0A0D7AVL3_9AGAR|nr:hypothetical protein CYLTODRAFT_447419 [Cylindrobasidium torrendii FP15055 ss-10]